MPIINAVSQACLPRRLLTFFTSAVIVGGLLAARPAVANAQYCGTNDCVFDSGFDCTFTCAAAAGPTMTITYE